MKKRKERRFEEVSRLTMVSEFQRKELREEFAHLKIF